MCVCVRVCEHECLSHGGGIQLCSILVSCCTDSVVHTPAHTHAFTHALRGKEGYKNALKLQLNTHRHTQRG